MKLCSYSSVDLSAAVCLLIAMGAAVLLQVSMTRRRRGVRLPPGPHPLPLIGNTFDVPKRLLAEEYKKLADKYGDVVYLNVLGHSMVILNTYAAASDLLDKRSTNYSSRPKSIMTDLIGADWAFFFDGYTPVWKTRRKEFHQHFTPNSISQYQHVQEETAQRLARDLITTPQELTQHVRLAFTSPILRIVYGLDVISPDDPLIVLEKEVQHVMDTAYSPGRYLVEIVPFLQHLPPWFPGAQFKRDAAVWRPAVLSLRDIPYEKALESMRQGTASLPSIVATMIDCAQAKGEMSEAEDGISRDVAASAYIAAIGTTMATFVTFLFAMASHPDVQKKAQAELDAVVGSSRPPCLDDRSSLPYLNALLSECLRWKAVAHLGLPHESLKDDEYNGCLIPGGSVILANLWTIGRDPRQYLEPDRFDPDRFLKDGRPNPDILDPREFAFGFGRRICPGQHFAEAGLFIAFACVLQALNIERSLDSIPLGEEVKMREGFITHPEDIIYNFSARIVAHK